MVGAPQYFEKDGEIGGAVYVYVNNAGKWDKVTPTRIDGAKDSMFGLSVENLGDINQDGYHGEPRACVLLIVENEMSVHCRKKLVCFLPDFAVGSPYDDDGAGKVYIYLGSASGLHSKTASQVQNNLIVVTVFLL